MLPSIELTYVNSVPPTDPNISPPPPRVILSAEDVDKLELEAENQWGKQPAASGFPESTMGATPQVPELDEATWAQIESLGEKKQTLLEDMADNSASMRELQQSLRELEVRDVEYKTCLAEMEQRETNLRAGRSEFSGLNPGEEHPGVGGRELEEGERDETGGVTLPDRSM